MRIINVKTDALYYHDPSAQNGIDDLLGGDIGQWKKTEYKSFPNALYMKENDYPYVQEYPSFVQAMTQQADIAKWFNEHDKGMVIADHAGSRKTHACKMYTNKQTTVWITLMNANVNRLKEEGYNAFTANRWFGVGVTGQSNNEDNVQKCDKSNYDTAVMDEMLLLNPKMLTYIYDEIQSCILEKYCSTGDVNQNLPIDNLLSANEDLYSREMDMLFPRKLKLFTNYPHYQ